MKYSKKMLFTIITLALSAITFNASATEGLCRSKSGMMTGTATFNKTLPVRVEVGQVIDYSSWSNPGWNYFDATCTGGNADYRYVTTTSSISAPAGHASGWYSLNEYLDFAVESETVTHLAAGKPYPASYSVPYSNIHTNGSYVDIMTVNSQNPDIQLYYIREGRVKLYLKKAFVGTKTFNTGGIIKYWVGVSTAGNQNVPVGANVGVQTLGLSGAITIPGYCDFSADQVKDVDLGSIAAIDIANKGSAANGKKIDFKVECNADSGAKVQIELSGNADSSDSSVLKTNLDNVGIKIQDKDNKAVNVNGGILPVTLDTVSGKGSTYVTASPYNTSGGTPEIGSYNAQLTASVSVD
jgi:type 1 fimbria pilin